MPTLVSSTEGRYSAHRMLGLGVCRAATALAEVKEGMRLEVIYDGAALMGWIQQTCWGT